MENFQFRLLILFFCISVIPNFVFAWSKKTIYGKTICEDAITLYIDSQYRNIATQKKLVMTEYHRIVSNYLSPTDWKSIAQRIDTANKDNKYFTDNIFEFGESTKIGPIIKEAFSHLPSNKNIFGNYDGPHQTTLQFSHFVDFNNYQYFFCLNKRVYLSLKKEVLIDSNLNSIVNNLKDRGETIIYQQDGQSDHISILTEKKRTYYYYKIYGLDRYTLSFDPTFATESHSKLVGDSSGISNKEANLNKDKLK